MGFFGSAGTFLGFAGNFVPGLGTAGGALASALLSKIDNDDPEAAVMLPPEILKPYEFKGALWGVEMSAWDLTDYTWSADGRTLDPLREDDALIVNEIRREVIRRGSPDRMIGQSLLYRAGPAGTWRKVRVGGVSNPPIRDIILTLKEWNKLAAEWKARVTAHALADPWFRQIDLRPWSEWGVDELMNVLDPASLWYEGNAYNDPAAFEKAKAKWIARTWGDGSANHAYDKWNGHHKVHVDWYAEWKPLWFQWREEQAKARQAEDAKRVLLAQFESIWLAAQQGAISNEQLQWLVSNGLANAAAALQFASAQVPPPPVSNLVSSPTLENSEGPSVVAANDPAASQVQPVWLAAAAGVLLLALLVAH